VAEWSKALVAAQPMSAQFPAAGGIFLRESHGVAAYENGRTRGLDTLTAARR